MKLIFIYRKKVIVWIILENLMDIKNTDKLLVVADPVMSEDGKTFIGCTGLATF